MDWTIELTEGQIISSDSEEFTLSDDADGSIILSDGATIEFDNIEIIM